MGADLSVPGGQTTASDPGAARTRIRQLPAKQVDDVTVLHAILDAGRLAHVGIVEAGWPWVLPTAYARDDDRVLLHGSTGSRLFRLLAEEHPACLTVTHLDGLVVARSAFESSMQYRSAMVVGRATRVDGPAQKLAALRTLTEHLMPGRWAQLRTPHRRELAATIVLSLPLTEWSVKVSAGPGDDDPDDRDAPVWAGVVPMRQAYGTPVPAPDLSPDRAVPAYVQEWTNS
ncbi:MAG: pyridoxamine 5'-phosphate oxidase family protein [Actinomycetes bacterium]